MTEHQRFASYTTLSAAATAVLVYVFQVADIKGLVVIAVFAAAILSGAITLALFIASLTKKPARTFDKLMNIFDLFSIWP